MTIFSQPAGQSCAVPSGSGTVVGAPIKVTITCPWHVLYVANNGRLGVSGNGSVSAFIIDPTTGALTQVPGSPFSAGAVPWFVTADKRGRFAYVSGLNSQGTGKSIFAFSIGATTGALTPVPGNPVAAGTTYGPILINPSGTFAYIEDGSDGVYAINPTTAYAANLDDDTLSGYAINATTGNLTPIPGSPFPVGGVGPNSIAITAVP